MPKFYVSFGQVHAHRVNGQTFDCDVLCEIDAEDYAEAREQAHMVFGGAWSMLYDATERPDIQHYFPRGVLPLERA
jgi:hypothetical protein